MKAWKRIHITKKRAACGVLGLLLLAAAYMGVPRAAEKVLPLQRGKEGCRFIACRRRSRRFPLASMRLGEPMIRMSCCGF